MNGEINAPAFGNALGLDGRTVLFSFLSRADATSLSHRSRAEGSVLDQHGKVVIDPAANPSTLALEPDPNLNFEHWSAYWRKVHGVRFLHTDGPSDEATLALLLRYDQIHRMAAGPASADGPPYQPPLDADGKLFDTVIGHIPPYRRPAWDGVAYLQFAGLEDLQAVLGTERFRRKIGPEDRAIFRDLAPLVARQHELLPGDPASEAVIMVKTHVRRDDLDRVTFVQRWLAAHSNLALARPELRDSVCRYAFLENVGPTDPGAPFYHDATAGIDGVSVIAFGSMRAAELFLVSDTYSAMVAAEVGIAQADASEYWTGVNLTVLDRPGM